MQPHCLQWQMEKQAEISGYAMRILKMQTCRCLPLNATVICLIAETLGQRVECCMERAVFCCPSGERQCLGLCDTEYPDTRY